MNFLETEDIVKQYSGHLALNKVSIQVTEGQIFGLLGPNGAGKTTLIRIINRITAPDSGMVRFNGRESQPEDIYRIGYLPEERGLYKKMKVGEQAIYLAQLKGLSYTEAKKRLTQWFEKFDIMPWWNRKLEELSKGMQQKVQFIITVIHQPDLLIFDEPFSGFDPVNAERLKQEILELKAAGHTIIFSTHNMASVEEICDEIALINQSRVVLSGHVSEVRNRFKNHTYTLKIATPDTGKTEPISADQPEEASYLSIEKPGTGTERKLYSLLSEKPHDGITELRIRKEGNITNSELLTTLAQRYEILSFVEELPSMNDIFINTVSGINTPNHE